jgi:hypothetical protein
LIGRIYHWPWDLLVEKTSARDRRSFGGWTLVLCIVGTIVLQVIGVRDVWWFLWLAFLSLVALVPNVSSETPVEDEQHE